MSTRVKQVLAGSASAIAAVAIAVLTASVFGFHVGTSAAGRLDVGTPIVSVGGDASRGISALNRPDIPVAPASVVGQLRSLHEGTYADAKTLGPGIYLASNNGAVCAWISDGFGQCVESFNFDDVWLEGDQRREYDSPSAPFEVNLYGIARDGVRSLRITTQDDKTRSVQVVNNAFRTTLKGMTFAEIAGVDKVYATGQSVHLDTSALFWTP